MASLINQMRNGQQQLQLQPQQPQLNQSIEATRNLMRQVKNAQDPYGMLAQVLQNNPNTPLLANMLHNGNSLEGVARAMAQSKGIDINQVINQLGGIL